QGILSWIAYHYLTDMRPQQIEKPGRMRALFKRDSQGAAQTVNESENRNRTGSKDGLHHQLAIRIDHGCGDACLVYIQTNKLALIHEGASFLSSSVFLRSLRTTLQVLCCSMLVRHAGPNSGF